MKKRAKNKVLLLLAGLVSLFAVGGCATGETMEEFLENRNLTAKVTYYANGGTFEGNSSEKYLYYQAGMPAFNLGIANTTSGSVEISRTRYTFGGWYEAKLDGKGNPIFKMESRTDADGKTIQYKIYEYGDPVDFSVRLEAEDEWHVVARWIPNVVVDAKLVCFNDDGTLDESATVTAKVNVPVVDADGKPVLDPVTNKQKYETKDKVYKHLDSVKTFTYGTNDQVGISDASEPLTLGDKKYTFVSYYEDEDCTKRITSHKRESDQEKDKVIYAKYVKGDWNVVRDEQDVQDMLQTTGANSYWLYKDIVIQYKDKDGNLSSRYPIAPKYTPGNSGDFNGKIFGNGFSIKGKKEGSAEGEFIGIQIKMESIADGTTLSIFGNITQSAVIKDLEMLVDVSYSMRNGTWGALYYAFASVANGATISNVKLSGKMTLSSNVSDGVEKGMYGGYADGEYDTNKLSATYTVEYKDIENY